MTGKYKVGDKLVVRVSKFSRKPGPRALNVHPTRGEGYTYQIDKYWVVREVRDDGQLVVVTRRGKQRLIQPDSPSLRRAHWWERLFQRARFADLSKPLPDEPIEKHHDEPADGNI